MTGEGAAETTQDEIALAHEEVAAAETLLRHGLSRIALTRTYFAVFHAIRARLYAEGLEPKTHAGAQQLFNQHFVKTGRYDAASSRPISRLQKYRQEADYAQAFVVDEAATREELAAARDLVAKISTDLEHG
jgi:uncharacterized protein (UPF0332 family)